DAREEVLIAAGKTDYFMWENRSENDYLIIVEKHAVDFHRHVHREQAIGQLADFIRGQRAHLLQCRRIVPSVIEQLHAAIGRTALGFRNLQAPAHGLFTQWLMRPESDQHIKSAGDAGNQLMERPE